MPQYDTPMRVNEDVTACSEARMVCSSGPCQGASPLKVEAMHISRHQGMSCSVDLFLRGLGPTGPITSPKVKLAGESEIARVSEGIEAS
jgi:hypothetical protein